MTLRRATRSAPPPRVARILKHATPQDLAEAVQANQAEWIRFEGHLPDVELHADRDATWICSSVRGRPNAVAMAHFPADEACERIVDILDRFASHNASAVWWVGPASRPLDLAQRLRDAGFHCFKHFPGMACDLAAFGTTRTAPGNLKVRRIISFKTFDTSEHPFFGPPTTRRRRTLIAGEQILCSIRPHRAFAFQASIDDEPLGHALLFLGAGVAGIYDVGVVRRARGQGIGTAVTCAALRHARRLGYRYATLQASGEAERVYCKIGFEEVCRISLWFYSRRQHEHA